MAGANPLGDGAVATLAAWSASLQWRDMPEAQRGLVPLRVLDTLGLILAGSRTEAARAALDFAVTQGGVQAASLFPAGPKLPAPSTALVHGVAAHARDFDDTFPESVVHPGSTVVSAALAAGESCGAEAEDIGAAIIAGYEIAARIGAVAGRRFHARGLHASGIAGPIAAAAAAARVLRLSPERTGWALGLAASMSGGLMAFQADGAWSKWLHIGWSAHGGIVAAELAARGFRGPLAALDGSGNLFAALLAGEAWDARVLTAELGTAWRGGEARFKYYPCAHVIQPYIDAALKLRAMHALSAADIAAVTCGIAPWAIPIVCEPRAGRIAPKTELDAIASLPYMLAHALADGTVGLTALDATSRARADLQALAGLVAHESDATMGRGFDARVTIRTKGGATHGADADAAILDPQRLRAKFVDNATPLLGAARARAAAGRLLAMPAPDIAALRDIFHAG